ncbi:MAG: hemerythrin domain-containing protein [Gallionella sp.]
MDLVWSNRLSVGNDMIDSEHKQLLKLVNNLDKFIRQKDPALFIQALTALEDMSRLHFSHEESLAKSIRFPFREHYLEHKYVLDEFRAIKAEIAAYPGHWSESLVEHFYLFLCTWAIEHVVEDDMKMKPFLEAYPHDFVPDDLA